MAIDWDAELLGPVMAVFGEGSTSQPDQMPLVTQGTASFRLADAVFDRAYADITIDASGAQVTTYRPCLGVRVALFPREPEQNNRIFIPSVDAEFVVIDVRPDGHGHARLMLRATGE